MKNKSIQSEAGAGLLGLLRRRRVRREARRLCHEARYTRHMREDLLPPDLLSRIEDGRRAVDAAGKRGDPKALATAREPLLSALREANPPRRGAGFRENFEMVVVAVAVAMAVRCFFLQPFKIPTGSMQPTLYGVTIQPQEGRAWYDRFPLNIPGWALFGEGYVEVRAKRTGVIAREWRATDDGYAMYIDGEPHEIRRDMPRFFDPGDRVIRGQRLASGRVRMGDQVFVNKIRYNFSAPVRGEVPVFDTRHIEHVGVRPNTYYIKRLCGLPGETLHIDPPYLWADGAPVREPSVFLRLAEDRDSGYAGFLPAPTPEGRPYPLLVLGDPEDRVSLGTDEFLMLGDNSQSSLDGRYFGSVQRESLVGPAFMVYWPFSPRWGPIRRH